MPTLSSQVVPQCTQVLLIVCKKKSPHSPHQPLRSRSSLHQNVNTPSGSEDQSWLHSPLSKLCGSANKNMMNLAQELFTVNASKSTLLSCQRSHLSTNDEQLTNEPRCIRNQQIFLQIILYYIHSKDGPSRTSSHIRFIIFSHV
jgi:hypothetical protein